MNTVSSRSHAIFTMHVTHRRVLQRIAGDHVGDAQALAAVNTDLVSTTAKYNFVDLAVRSGGVALL